MRKIFTMVILFVFIMTNTYIGYAEDFMIESNLPEKTQLAYKNKIDNIFDNLYEKQISKKSLEKQIEFMEKVSSKIDTVLEKKISEKNKFALSYLQYQLDQKVEVVNTWININITNTTNNNQNNSMDLSDNSTKNTTKNSNNTTSMVDNSNKNSNNTNIKDSQNQTNNSNNQANTTINYNYINSNNNTNNSTNTSNSNNSVNNTNNSVTNNNQNNSINTNTNNSTNINNSNNSTNINNSVNTDNSTNLNNSVIDNSKNTNININCGVGTHIENGACVNNKKYETCLNKPTNSKWIEPTGVNQTTGVFTSVWDSGIYSPLKSECNWSCNTGYKAENGNCVKIPLNCENPLGGSINHNSSAKVGTIDKTENNGVYTYEVFKTCNDGVLNNEIQKNQVLKTCNTGYKAENGSCVVIDDKQWREISGTNCSNDDYVFTLEGKTYTWAGCNSVLGTTGVQGDYDGKCENYGIGWLELNRSACYGSTEKEINYSSTVGENNIWGKLYTWENANKPNNACPTGWHLSSDDEFRKLETFLNSGKNCLTDAYGGGDRGYICGGLGWGNKSDRSARDNLVKALKLPLAGERNDYTYYNRGSFGSLWTSTKYDNSSAYTRRVGYSDSYINRNYNSIIQGYSVRCVKD